MSSGIDLSAERALLSELAELSLAVARDLSAAAVATDDVNEMVRLSDAFTRVGRCVRMSIALSARLARGEPLARQAREPREIEHERDESVLIEERPEREERENLFDRLPAGDLGVQIATIARTLSIAAKALPAPAAERHRTRCREFAAKAATPGPRPPGRDYATSASVIVLDGAVARPRGPPH